MTQGIYQFPQIATLELIDEIAAHHWEEWQSSAVSKKIISRSVRTLTDAREVDKVLNRNTKSRRKHSNNLIPCWMVSGVNPLTGENTLEGVQIKPDVAPVGKDGKLQKYLGAVGYGASPLFLDTGVEGYWQQILEDKSTPIIITEGAKKAGAGLTLGIPTISIPGVSTCRKFGRLHYWLEAYAGFGRTFYLCFDADILEKRPVQNALLSLARDLCATGSKVMIITLPFVDLKGMDDFIAAKGGDEFKRLMEESPTIEEWKKELDEKRKSQEFDFEEEERKSKLYRAYKTIKKGWGDSIRLNLLKKHIELDGSRMDLDLLRFYISEEFDIDISKEDSHMIVMAIAKNNAYSPVVEYLDSLAVRYPNPDLSILDNLALKYFGSTDPLHNTYIKKALIAAVARARQPGCKADDACILVGEQGLRKSTFWRELFAADWFTDELSDSNEKDELMKLHQFWGLELPEIEHIYKRKDVGSIKKFLSSSTDAFRYPYEREIKEHPRACILVGTSNEQELLNDPTGNRRFWIIPVSQAIPVEELIRERDLIWAAANHLYQMGHIWYLTHAEYQKQTEANKEYQSSDPWEEIILAFVQNKQGITTHDILLNGLQIETGRQDKMAERRVSSVLRQDGWYQKRERVNGRVLRVWFRKVEKTSGSSGSSGSTQVQQDFEYDPDVFPHLDHLDQYEQLELVQNTQETISDPDDPDTKKYLDHPESSHSKLDPDDPDDPDIFPTFPENKTEECSEVIVNGFRLGEKVIITAHEKQPDWVGSEEEIKRFGHVWVSFTSGRSAKFEHIRPVAITPQPTLAEQGYQPKDTIRITDNPRPELVGREEVIKSVYDKSIQTLSGLFLNAGQFEKCEPSPKKPTFSSLKEGDICFCLLHNTRAKIQTIIKSTGEAEIYLAKGIELYRVKLSDLRAEEWRLDVGHKALYGSDVVKIVGFKNNGREFQVEHPSGRLEYVKAGKLSKPPGVQ